MKSRNTPQWASEIMRLSHHKSCKMQEAEDVQCDMLIRWAADNRLGYSSGLINTSQKEGISFLCAAPLFELLKKRGCRTILAVFQNWLPALQVCRYKNMLPILVSMRLVRIRISNWNDTRHLGCCRCLTSSAAARNDDKISDVFALLHSTVTACYDDFWNGVDSAVSTGKQFSNTAFVSLHDIFSTK